MQLKYTDGTVPQYNGNIANQLWGVPGTLDKTYTYKYDNINRLLSGASSTNDRERSIVYDQRGNITNLTRFSNNTIIDSLTYNYTIGSIATNQLQSVNDLTASDLGQKHGSFTYTYDGNGNMVTDNSKGITIAYNLLNLPQSIAAKSTTYTYDAGGNKLRRVVGTIATDYIDGIQYDSGAISFIQTEEGRALPNGATAYNYEYTLNDHLGNSRVGFDLSNNAARLVQTSNYYPFGLEAFNNTASNPKNYYLYNKKELQENIGLYDYGARLYDPVIGRFTTIDPVAEHFPWMTSYQYASNDPIKNIDLDGLEGLPFSFFFENTAITPKIGPAAEIAGKYSIENIAKAGGDITEGVIKSTRPRGRMTPENLESFKRGNAAETEQLAKRGLEKNTQPYKGTDPKTGKEETTIPDAIKEDGTTVEVKNVKQQGFTKQLRLQEKQSNENGGNPELIINQGAKISKPLRNSSFDISTYQGPPLITRPDAIRVAPIRIIPSKAPEPPPCTNCY